MLREQLLRRPASQLEILCLYGAGVPEIKMFAASRRYLLFPPPLQKNDVGVDFAVQFLYLI